MSRILNQAVGHLCAIRRRLLTSFGEFEFGSSKSHLVTVCRHTRCVFVTLLRLCQQRTESTMEQSPETVAHDGVDAAGEARSVEHEYTLNWAPILQALGAGIAGFDVPGR